MIRQRIEEKLNRRRCTLLGVGPMSENSVNAAIELANEHDVLLFLIASRRQIECEAQGGGYVNNWTTETFAEYVTNRDLKGKILLARDHGGPWQNSKEIDQKLSLKRAMTSAKASFEADIVSGFDLIHIDPSVDPFSTPQVDEILDRIFELYEFCWEVARQNRREILFEIGTEEQSGAGNSQDELEYVLEKTTQFCSANHLPPPLFVVVQTGTRTMETRNIGTFDAPFGVKGELPSYIQVPKMLKICEKFGVFMKEHNTDYLSNEALSWHPKLGIHAANVAPEFGVAETRALLKIIKETPSSADLEERFLALAYNSGKWKKWMLPDTNATDLDRATIAGHYVFSLPECREIKEELQKRLNRSGINLDDVLKAAVKTSISRYLSHFRHI